MACGGGCVLSIAGGGGDDERLWMILDDCQRWAIWRAVVDAFC